ncbi:MAG TPA: bifunctional 4-hydroxy-2-oxoglutarate aldolase/2-dehydro-3-deoxy-phosphogluconate aldolase [Bacillus sp. (in: firmicutes)]|nr:bifunctional 4-hydroxy-2-oxoglutarate aldolase/2-dehydro-3-deoxy-phosphogluconate aldolase [Bacillus sp. (in: firmicutes)]
MEIKKGTIIAILRGIHPDKVCAITEVLVENGITWLEVSLSEEENGIGCIEKIHAHFGDKVHLGAGTVMNPNQVDRVIDAGAQYIITPGWDRDLVRYTKMKKVEIFPGVFSPGEIMQAIQEGVEVVKLFPVNDLGLSYGKNLRGPYPDLKIMGVGGVDLQNIREYAKAGCSFFAIGSDLVPRGATTSDLSVIKEKAKQYVELMKEIGS